MVLPLARKDQKEEKRRLSWATPPPQAPFRGAPLGQLVERRGLREQPLGATFANTMSLPSPEQGPLSNHAATTWNPRDTQVPGKGHVIH